MKLTEWLFFEVYALFRFFESIRSIQSLNLNRIYGERWSFPDWKKWFYQRLRKLFQLSSNDHPWNFPPWRMYLSVILKNVWKSVRWHVKDVSWPVESNCHELQHAIRYVNDDESEIKTFIYILVTEKFRISNFTPKRVFENKLKIFRMDWRM